MTKRIAWFASFTTAVTVTLLMWIAGYDWLTTLGTAAVSCVALPDMLLRQRSNRLTSRARRTDNAAGRSRGRRQRQTSLNGSGDIAV
jgi:hypothetical protein